MKKPLTVGLSLFVLLGVAACGGEEEEAGIEDEAPGNDVALVAEDYNEFDADNNDELSVDEFNEGVYENFDTDASETIGEDEFNAGSNVLYNDYDGNFADLDADNNDELGQDEFNASVEDSGLYGEFDADNANGIAEEEFSEGI